jgi:hypothetical protein
VLEAELEMLRSKFRAKPADREKLFQL